MTSQYQRNEESKNADKNQTSTVVPFDRKLRGLTSPTGNRFPVFRNSPDTLIKAFNTRAFKREQPDKIELMRDFAAEAIKNDTPLSFVTYWGKGFRPTLAQPELTCLDYIGALGERVRQSHRPGASISIVFTDTHAGLNGHSAESRASYFKSLGDAAVERGFSVRKLSEVVTDAGFTMDSPDVEEPSEEILASLYSSAAKWFKGEGTTQEGAHAYFKANMVERRAMDFTFPRSIFITFNGSGLKSLFPQTLPIFYMFSLRHGVSDKPWFLPVDFMDRYATPETRVLAPSA